MDIGIDLDSLSLEEMKKILKEIDIQQQIVCDAAQGNCGPCKNCSFGKIRELLGYKTPPDWQYRK